MTDVLPSSEMIELDGDEERISSQGRYAERDIVQVQTWLTDRETVRSAERPQRTAGFMINGKRSLCLTLCCALIPSAIFLSPSLRLAPLNCFHLFLSVLFTLYLSFTASPLIFYLTSLFSTHFLFFIQASLLLFSFPVLIHLFLSFPQFPLLSFPLPVCPRLRSSPLLSSACFFFTYGPVSSPLPCSLSSYFISFPCLVFSYLMALFPLLPSLSSFPLFSSHHLCSALLFSSSLMALLLLLLSHLLLCPLLGSSLPFPSPLISSYLLSLFLLHSLFLSETTLTGGETTSSAWLVWLRKCLLKSQTSSCPT